MADVVLRIAGYAGLVMLAMGVAALIRRRRTSCDVRALPDARQRVSLLARLREMRAASADLDTCMRFLRQRGLRRGVAEGLLIDLERQQAADCERPREGSWNGYAFRYPGNWRIRPLVAEAGRDAGISIEGLGSALVMLVRADAAGAGYAELVAEQEAEIRDPQRAPLTAWGSLCGRGALLTGPHVRLKLLVEVQVFCPSDVPVPFHLVEFHAVEEEPLVRPGFELVQATLTATAS